MNEVEWLKLHDHDGLQAPVVDVAQRVMRAVRARPSEDEQDRLLPCAAFAAAAMGIVALIFAAPSWETSSSPFAGFGDVVNLVLR